MKKFRWDKKYLYWGITAFLVIIACLVFFMALNHWGTIKTYLNNVFRILMPVIYGLVIAYLLTPLVKVFERKVFCHIAEKIFKKNEKNAKILNRVLSMAASFLIAFTLILLLLTMLLPELYGSLESLVKSLPSYFNNIVEFLRGKLDDFPELETLAINILDNANDYIINWVQTAVLENVNALITSVYSGVFEVLKALSNLFIGIIFSIYIIYNRELFAAQCKKVFYSIFKKENVTKILTCIDYVDKSFGGFIIGKIMDSAIIGLICFVFLAIVDMPYTALVSVVVGVTNMIPFFGPFIGAIPSALIILMESPVKCLIFIVFIIILQQIDGNIIGPKILSSATGLNGFWVMVSIIVGGGLFGIIGMFCGVPIFSIIYTGVKYLIGLMLEKKEMSAETTDYLNKEE